MSNTDQHDVAVIGAGIIGVMSAWQLAKQGHRVTVYDQWNTPNDRGASAGESRIFRTVYKEGSEYVPMLRKSLPLWEELQAAQDTTVLQMCGGLTIGHPDHPDIRAVIDCAEAEGLSHEVLDHDQMAQRYPQFGLDEDEVGVYDPAAGIFRPELAVLAAREQSKQLGATYRPYSRVLNIREAAGRVAVDTGQDAVHYDKVVLATGPWAAELAGLDRDLIKAQQLAAGWFPAEDVIQHQPENMPISIRRHPDAGFSCFPILDGMAVKILPHHLQWPNLEAPEELPRFVAADVVQAAERAVARLMPGLDPTAIRVSTWTEGFTPDGVPLVGPSPANNNVILAVGMSGQGFKFAPMIGSIVADYVSTNESADAIDIMSSRRFEKE